MTPEELKQLKEEIKKEILKNLRIEISNDTHVYTDKDQIIVTLFYEGKEIDSDFVTL